MSLFRVCREIAASMTADVRAGRFPNGFCAHSRGYYDVETGDLAAQITSICNDYPLEMKSPFEDVKTISGGVWRASEIFGGDDALLRLHFRKRTLDLPLHSHDHSDRVIFVAEGCGVFEYLVDSLDKCPRSIEIKAGDVIVFSRGTVHSFKTGEHDLQLLSYHSPYIELSDTRQFTLFHQPDGRANHGFLSSQSSRASF